MSNWIFCSLFGLVTFLILCLWHTPNFRMKNTFCYNKINKLYYFRSDSRKCSKIDKMIYFTNITIKGLTSNILFILIAVCIMYLETNNRQKIVYTNHRVAIIFESIFTKTHNIYANLFFFKLFSQFCYLDISNNNKI